METSMLPAVETIQITCCKEVYTVTLTQAPHWDAALQAFSVKVGATLFGTISQSRHIVVGNRYTKTRTVTEWISTDTRKKNGAHGWATREAAIEALLEANPFLLPMT